MTQSGDSLRSPERFLVSAKCRYKEALEPGDQKTEAEEKATLFCQQARHHMQWLPGNGSWPAERGDIFRLCWQSKGDVTQILQLPYPILCILAELSHRLDNSKGGGIVFQRMSRAELSFRHEGTAPCLNHGISAGQWFAAHTKAARPPECACCK